MICLIKSGFCWVGLFFKDGWEDVLIVDGVLICEGVIIVGVEVDVVCCLRKLGSIFGGVEVWCLLMGFFCLVVFMLKLICFLFLFYGNLNLVFSLFIVCLIREY